MEIRKYWLLLGIGCCCTGCHLLHPVFSKSTPSASTKGSGATPAVSVSNKKNSGSSTVSVRSLPASSLKNGNTGQLKNESVKPLGFRPSDQFYLLQEPPALLQIKYAILLDVVAEKLTNTSLLQVMDTWWGTRYCMGGSTDNCIDCSAFVQILYRDVYQFALPRTAREQYDASELIDKDELKEGDLVFFHTTGRRNAITHVGVYLLNNKFVHASSSIGVGISDLDEPYWKSRYKGAGRLKSQI
ncbi:MAG: C40 family peptidase [Sediminibacterium sp.]